MEWRLRRAGPADTAALSLVAGATFLQTFADLLEGADIIAHVTRHSSAEAFAHYIGTGAIATLAEAAGGAPIGYTLLTSPDLPVEPRAGDIELKRIYVLAGAHGGGTGPALMAQAVEDARAAGHARMLLGVYGENWRARRFYEKQGFAVVGTRRFLVGATLHDDLIYARDV